MITIIACITENKIIYSDELYGNLSGAPHILSKLQESFEKEPTVDNFKKLMNDYYDMQIINYNELEMGGRLDELVYDKICSDSTVIFNACDYDIILNTPDYPSVHGDVIKKHKIYHN